MKKKIFGVALAIIICELAGGIGALFVMPSIGGWYAGLIKSSLNPPNWVFGLVWTTLFALMGMAAFLVWNKKNDRTAKTALMIFVFQFVLNILWSVLFFGAHSPVGAFIDIILLLLAILWTTSVFYKINRATVWFLVPYFLWVILAAYLNYSVIALN